MITRPISCLDEGITVRRRTSASHLNLDKTWTWSCSEVSTVLIIRNSQLIAAFLADRGQQIRTRTYVLGMARRAVGPDREGD